MPLEDHWPLFGLSITTDRLQMRYPTDDDFSELVDVLQNGVHDPAMMPFTTPWTDGESPERERSALQYWWSCRAGFSVSRWEIPFVIEHDGQIVGVQALSGVDFPTLRTTETGSWLGLPHHGLGIGKEMRAAAVQFAFECLDASAVTSAAFADNIASQRVSEATGYEPNGTQFVMRRGTRDKLVRFLLTRERWEETRTGKPADIRGFDACRSQLGLTQN